MRKLALASLLAAIVVATAVATTFNVPFYNDGGGNLSGGFPPSGYATFIAIRNPDLDSAVQGQIYYYDNDGSPRTPTPNTFTIPAGASYSFRPVKDDAAEGVGRDVPNKNGGNAAGTATIVMDDSTLAPGEVYSGRVVVLEGNTRSQSAFTLLPQ